MDNQSDPQEPQDDGEPALSEPHEPQNDGEPVPNEPHEPQAGLVLDSAHDFPGGVGHVVFDDDTTDPMEIMEEFPEKHSKVKRGLSEES